MKKFKVGTKFQGNVNKANLQVIAIKDDIVTVQDLRTKKIFTYGFEALKHCDLIIL